MEPSQKYNATAFILAGGKSTRMGTDKGLLPYRGKEMVKWSLDLVEPVFSETNIIANSPQYAKFGFTLLEDILKDCGPLAGIFTGLKYSATDWNFFIACDMPAMQFSVIEKLWKERQGYDGVVPYFMDFPESMCAFYNKTCLPVIEKQLSAGHFKIQDIFPALKIKLVDFSVDYAPADHPFRNINSKSELPQP